MPTACVVVYGCQQNEADGERIRGTLLSLGYGLASEHGDADVVLLVTCSVRESAENRIYGIIGGMKKSLKPGALLGLCGCMATRENVREKIKRSYPWVKLIVTPDEIDRLPELLSAETKGGNSPFRAPPPRALIPIMSGCNNFCSYCVVPYTRGRERSRGSQEVLRECAGLIRDGYTELFLLGQNVNSYRPLGENIDFPELLTKINALEGDFGISFMTSHPKDASKKLFEAIAAAEKVERELHLPLQSGSNRMLQAMNRGYTVHEYLEKLESARAAVPGIRFGTDVIVGFPGESDADFEATFDILKTVRFSRLFGFMYSPRSGTAAAELEDSVPDEVKHERLNTVLRLQKAL